MARRLLDIIALCEKLSCGTSTFRRRRAELEEAGFPKPALSADEFGGERWDEKAIDLFFDNRMPLSLRRRDKLEQSPVDTRILESTLKNRAREMTNELVPS